MNIYIQEKIQNYTVKVDESIHFQSLTNTPKSWERAGSYKNVCLQCFVVTAQERSLNSSRFLSLISEASTSPYPLCTTIQASNKGT